MANPNDLFNAVRNYANALNNGDKTPAQMMEEVNTWFKDSSQEIKQRIEKEVIKSVEKMGFAKKREVEKLRAEIEKLKSVKKQSAKKTTAPRKKKK
jgi:hypothetical protein